MTLDKAALLVVEFHEARTVRLISTAYLNEPALAPLADDPAEAALLAELEALTSARLGSLALPDGVEPGELLTEAFGFGWSYVNAAFCHAKPPGNRFNDETRGAWYAAFGPDDSAIAEAEVAFHIANALREAGARHETVAYRELLAGFTCRFHDLRAEPTHPALDPEMHRGYPAGQALAATIRAAGGNGLLYPSVRRKGGNCLAAFRPSVVQNVRLGETLRLEWNGEAMRRVA